MRGFGNTLADWGSDFFLESLRKTRYSMKLLFRSRGVASSKEFSLLFLSHFRYNGELDEILSKNRRRIFELQR